MAIKAPKDLTDCQRFFTELRHPKQRQYEALRAYFVEHRPSNEVARAFGYSPGAFRVLCHQFRSAPDPAFFIPPRPGPRTQPKKSAARNLIITLRKRNYSVYEISEVLKEQKVPLSPTAVREVLKAEGFTPLPRRRDEERPNYLRPTIEPVANVHSFSLAPRHGTTRCGGLFLFLPDLVRLSVDHLAAAAHLPGSRMIPAGHALRACLGLKLFAIERHYVSARSRRQPSVLTFLAQDAQGQAFCYSNADLRKGEEAEEIFRFIEFWKKSHGELPRHLVFDSRLTTYDRMARLDKMGISFITLRRRSPALLKEIVLLPRSAWCTVALDVPTRKYRTPRVHEKSVQLAGHKFRQLFILDLGHEDPTILLSNEARTSLAKLITRYAQRMLIENALSDAVRFFHIDALSSTVGLKVDFDMALLVIASGLYRLLARHMRGYHDAQARQIFRDLIDMPADIDITETEVIVRFHRRAHLPIILASGLLDKPVNIPWWNQRPLRLTT